MTFGKLSEICSRYLTPGKLIYVEGRLQTRNWQDQEGKSRSTIECIVNTMQMLGSRADAAREEKSSHSEVADRPVSDPQARDEEIPF